MSGPGEFAAPHRAKAFVSLENLARTAMLPDGVTLVDAEPALGGVFITFDHPALPPILYGVEAPIIHSPGYTLVETTAGNVPWYRREYEIRGLIRGSQQNERTMPTFDLRADRPAFSKARLDDIVAELSDTNPRRSPR